MTTAFSLSQTRERLSAFAAATTMTLVVMAGITTLAQTEHAVEQGLQAQVQPALQTAGQPAVQQVVVIGQRLPRTESL
jgi:hypothetical protein